MFTILSFIKKLMFVVRRNQFPNSFEINQIGISDRFSTKQISVYRQNNPTSAVTTQIWFVRTLFLLFRHRTDFRLAPNQSGKRNYNKSSFGIVLLYFRTSEICIEAVVSWIPDAISWFQNRSICMLFLEASDCTDESR